MSFKDIEIMTNEYNEKGEVIEVKIIDVLNDTFNKNLLTIKSYNDEIEHIKKNIDNTNDKKLVHHLKKVIMGFHHNIIQIEKDNLRIEELIKYEKHLIDDKIKNVDIINDNINDNINDKKDDINNVNNTNDKVDNRLKKDKKTAQYTLNCIKRYQQKNIINKNTNELCKNPYFNKKIDKALKLIEELKNEGIIIDNKIDINNREIIKKLGSLF
jgi:hypothetical protein